MVGRGWGVSMLAKNSGLPESRRTTYSVQLGKLRRPCQTFTNTTRASPLLLPEQLYRKRLLPVLQLLSLRVWSSRPFYNSGAIFIRGERQHLGGLGYERSRGVWMSSRILAIEEAVLLWLLYSRKIPKVHSCTATSSCHPAPHSSQRSVTETHQNTRESQAIQSIWQLREFSRVQAVHPEIGDVIYCCKLIFRITCAGRCFFVRR